MADIKCYMESTVFNFSFFLTSHSLSFFSRTKESFLISSEGQESLRARSLYWDKNERGIKNFNELVLFQVLWNIQSKSLKRICTPILQSLSSTQSKPIFFLKLQSISASLIIQKQRWKANSGTLKRHKVSTSY